MQSIPCEIFESKTLNFDNFRQNENAVLREKLLTQATTRWWNWKPILLRISWTSAWKNWCFGILLAMLYFSVCWTSWALLALVQLLPSDCICMEFLLAVKFSGSSKRCGNLNPLGLIWSKIMLRLVRKFRSVVNSVLFALPKNIYLNVWKRLFDIWGLKKKTVFPSVSAQALAFRRNVRRARHEGALRRPRRHRAQVGAALREAVVRQR